MLTEKTAIVTGASRGIGKAIALKLAEQGANVILHGTSVQHLQDVSMTISQLGARCTILVGDVADPQTATKAVELANREFGVVDILVNNAGINTRSPTLKMPLQDWHRVMDVNLNGTLHFCRSVLPGMIRQKGGKIVNVSSTTAKTAHPNAAPAYGASKAAINYLTRHLALEMAGYNIFVNAVCPGPVESDMSAQWSDEYRQCVTAGVPLGRLGTPGNIADVVFFLVSGMSDFITGETLNANGGTTMD